MEYLLIGIVAVIFCGCHYGLTKWARSAMDPENRGFDIPFPLWVHSIIAIPSVFLTALAAFLLLKVLA